MCPDVAVSAVGEARLQPRGSSQGGLAEYNERTVLQAIRLHGPVAGAEIARLTHLTAQTVSMITKRLLDEGLILKGTPLRGKVGQPSVPLVLDPEGAYSVGVMVGRRQLDVLLVDFQGRVRKRSSCAYEFPDPAQVLREIDTRVRALKRALGPDAAARLQGIGLAVPLSLGGWQQLLGFSADLAAAWERTDLRAEVAASTGLRTTQLKDTAAACVAELVAGRGRSIPSFLYVFVDTFIGGGLVIDSTLRAGLHGNAGAIGSLSMGTPAGAAPAQLLSSASLSTLEGLYAEAGLPAGAATDGRALQAPWAALTRVWLQQAATGIALAAHASACLLDLDSVVVDGSFDPGLLAALLVDVEQAFGGFSWEGVARPTLLGGTIGADARALGGALLPLYANFTPDRALFLKVAAG